MTWALVHLVAVAALAGVGWVVQVVVYPAFALVGDPEWGRYHAAHQRAIAAVVLLPWAAQGVSVVVLAVQRGPLAPEVAALGALALATVVLTAAAAVPAHGRLAARRDPADLRRLLRANLARTLAWTAAVPVAALAAALPA